MLVITDYYLRTSTSSLLIRWWIIFHKFKLANLPFDLVKTNAHLTQVPISSWKSLTFFIQWLSGQQVHNVIKIFSNYNGMYVYD